MSRSKLQKCRVCGHLIASVAPRCIGCGTPGPRARASKMTGTRIVGWASAAILLTGGILFVVAEKPYPTVPPSGVPSVAPKATPPEPASSPFASAPNFRVRLIPAVSPTVERWRGTSDELPDSIGWHSRVIDAGNLETLKVTLTDEQPVSVQRVLINKRDGIDGCDYRYEGKKLSLGDSISVSGPVLPDLFSKDFVDKIDKWQMDHPAGKSLSGNCGEILEVEIFTDRGSSKYSFKEKD